MRNASDMDEVGIVVPSAYREDAQRSARQIVLSRSRERSRRGIGKFYKVLTTFIPFNPTSSVLLFSLTEIRAVSAR